MKKKEKFLAPIYGLKRSPKQTLILEKSILLRSVNLLAEEYKLFKSFGLKGIYDAVLEIEYEFNPEDPSEPFPNLFINVVNKIDASLVVYGKGKVGIAAVLPATKDSFPGGGILSSAYPHYDEKLDKELDQDFVSYYKIFGEAYNARPLAFDIFRRSRERFTNHDKTVDCCTVLESIFVPKGEWGKKPFIINGMKIMGFSSDEIKSIDDLIELRNAVIHADKEKIHKLYSGAKFTYSWFEETFQLVRKILYKYVENPWN